MKKIKIIFFLIALFFIGQSFINNTTRPAKIEMNNPTVKTSIGEIAYFVKEVKGTIPIIFLHGVYYDHRLWDYYFDRVNNRTVIAIDMPLHGQSKKITKEDWTMSDCSDMLIEILDELSIDKCYAVGHSWGSMTILRAASKYPNRFTGLLFSNMPLEAGGLGAKLQFGLQHAVLPFRNFYSKQVAKAMFAKDSRTQKPEVVNYLQASMSQLSNRDIRKTDNTVITSVGSGFPYLDNLKVAALAIKGKNDYVPTPKNIETLIVDGQHTTPLEQPEQVLKLINRLTNE